MKTNLRKIGNSRGVLIPASFLSACKIEDEIELRIDGKRLVIEPVREPRAGWFAGYKAEKDADAWEGAEGLASDEDWKW